MKGTEFLIVAIETLQQKGFACELVLIEKLPRKQALRAYAEADIVADQFCMGGWAQFALEGMALGKPVLAYLNADYLADPVFNMPVVNATDVNLPAVLAVLIEHPILRARLGEASRAAVQRYQSIEAMGEVWGRIYRHVWWRDPLALANTAHFSPERKPRAMTEDPAVAEFWPVDVSDLLDSIRATLTRLSDV